MSALSFDVISIIGDGLGGGPSPPDTLGVELGVHENLGDSVHNPLK